MTRCIVKGCGKFVYAHALWCRECEPLEDCLAESCAPYRGLCCMTEAALEYRGVDPWSDPMTWREQADLYAAQPEGDVPVF